MATVVAAFAIPTGQPASATTTTYNVIDLGALGGSQANAAAIYDNGVAQERAMATSVSIRAS